MYRVRIATKDIVILGMNDIDKGTIFVISQDIIGMSDNMIHYGKWRKIMTEDLCELVLGSSEPVGEK